MLLSQFYTWGNWGTEMLSDLPDITQLVGGAAGVWTLVVWLQSPCTGSSPQIFLLKDKCSPSRGLSGVPTSCCELLSQCAQISSRELSFWGCLSSNGGRYSSKTHSRWSPCKGQIPGTPQGPASWPAFQHKQKGHRSLGHSQAVSLFYVRKQAASHRMLGKPLSATVWGKS